MFLFIFTSNDNTDTHLKYHQNVSQPIFEPFHKHMKCQITFSLIDIDQKVN